jgi:hypothetical protein
MSDPVPTEFYLWIWREPSSVRSWMLWTSLSPLMRYLENMRDAPEMYDPGGGFDVYVINTEAVEIGKYDVGPLVKMLRKTKSKAAAK